VILYPAIDIHEGAAVRLTKGDFDRATVYADDPLEAARAWVAAGARFLHVVDLDGARAGEPVSLGHLERITRELSVPVQYGGGLRTLPAVREALRAGAARVVLGTAAYTEVDLLDEGRCRLRIAPRRLRRRPRRRRLDRRLDADDADAGRAVIERLIARGVQSFVYTAVDRDGMLEGPDLDEVRRVADAVRGRFVYSGGSVRWRPRGAARPAPGQPRGVIVARRSTSGASPSRRGSARSTSVPVRPPAAPTASR